jgi:hypothetical protein
VRVEILIALACSAVTMLGVVYLGVQFFDSTPPPSQPQAKGIVWGGRTFVDLAEFSRWLRSQGVAYEVWALRHPTRAGIVPLRPPTVPQTDRAQPSEAGHRSTRTTVAGVAVILAALSILLGIRRRRWLLRLRGELTRDRRVADVHGVAAAAAAGAQRMLRLAARGVAAAAVGARLVSRLAFMTARASWNWTRSVTLAVWGRRGELAWYIAGALIATMSALAVTAWA